MYELLDAWGHEGLISHVKKMQTDYKNRAAIVQEAAGESAISVQAPAQSCVCMLPHRSTTTANHHDGFTISLVHEM